MDNNLIHPSDTPATVQTPTLAVQPAPVVAAPPVASVQATGPIGFTATPQASAMPVALPVNPVRPQVLPVAEDLPQPLPAGETQMVPAPVRVGRKSRAAWKVAAVASVFMVLVAGTAYVFNRGQQVAPSNSLAAVNGGTVIPEQDLSASLPVDQANPFKLQGSEDTLVVNGDLLTTGALKLRGDDFFTSFVQGTVTADRTITLPDTDGTICLDSNNCGFATAGALNGLQTTLQVVAAAANNSGVASFNGQSGEVNLTGGNGITITDLGAGQFQISSGGASGTVSLGPTTPQLDSSNNASINLTKTGSGNLLQLATGVPASPVQRFVVDQNGAITVGTIDFSQVANRPSLVNSLGGVQGGITLGTGLQMSGQSLLNSGVTSLNGETGGVSLFAGTGIGISGTTITNLGVTEILGTPNQISAVPSSGVVTLALAQDIDVSSTPVFAGLTVNGPVDANSVATNGTVRITTGGVLQNVTNANAGTFFTGGTLSVGRGGTGAASFTANGILFGNGTGAVGVTAAGADGQCLVANSGTAPSWISCLTASEGAAPGGGAGGDLTGTYPNPTIAKLQGTNLTITGGTLADSQFLMFDGTAWVNQGLYGDVAVAADGLVELADNSVTTNTIANNSVTNGKLANDSITITAGTGLSGGGLALLGGSASLDVLYGATSGTAVQGDTTLTVTAGTNLSGGGTVTLGNGGTVTVNTVNNPNFSTSVTTPILQGATSLTIGTLATADANDIIISAAGAEVGRFLENGDYRFEKGTFDLTLSTSSITGSNKTITLPNETGTICTTGSLCAGYAAAAGSNNYVQLQGDSPGTPQNGNFNLSGTGIIGTLDATTIATNGVTRLTSAGVLQDVTNGNAGTFFTGGTLGVARGGTGMVTFTQYGVVFGNGSGALGVTVAGGTNQCLVGNTGAAPSWIDCDVAAEGAEPGGTAGGDLSGTYPNPTLAKLQGTDLLINSPVAGHTLVYNATNSRWDNIALSGDVSINETGVATIAANSVALGTDTTGNYVTALGTLIGLSTTGNTGEGSTPTLSVTYGSSANTAVQGNTSITINAGDNIDGGGSITLGAGGSLTLDLGDDLTANSLALSTALGVGSGGTGATAFTANGILFGNGTGALGVTAAGTTGQCLVGQTGSVPTWASCTAAAGGSTPGGSAGGDLTGTYPNPTLAKLQGSTITLSSLSAGQFLVYNTTNGRWQNASMTGDISLSETGATTITSNAVALGADTTGNYIATLGTLTGLSVTGNTGESSTPALSVTYGSSANTAVQGNTTLTVTAGTNLTGGGAVTLGAGGTITLETSPDPTFNSVSLTNALGVASGGIGTNSLTSGGVLLGNGTGAITTSGVLTNGQLLIGDGTGAPTVATLTGGTGITITNGAGSINVAVNNTVCTTAGVCSGYAPASGSANYVNVQGTTPGTPQTGNLNISGVAIVGSLDATSVLTNGTTRLTSAGVLQNVTNANAGTFFTGGTLGVSRGGTGLGSITSNGLVYGNGTGAVGVTAAGASGQCLVGNTGSAPTWADCLTVGGGGTPSGAAGGDLSGTYPNPTIGKLQGTNLSINTPTGGHMLIYNATNTRWENVAISSDVTISETGVATIAANSVALGTDTTGNYVATLGTLTGLSATGNTGEGSTPTLSVLYGSTSNTAVQGNVTVVCPSGSGNINGGGNTITLGTGGTCNAISITNAPSFSTSVTSPIFQGSGAMTLNTLATAGADNIVFSTAGVQVATILENGNFGIGAAVTAPTAKLQVDGTTLVKTSTNTVSAFEIQNSSSAVLLTADTTNQTVSIGVASGGKVINIPASVSLNTAATIDTTTSAAATEGVNQKKIVKLSDGKLVAIFNGGGPTAETWYSTNNGASWTEYGTGSIAGWTNGSISTYVDSGGTERLVAVWKQSGTGGSRSDGYIYTMTGAFNPARTTLTWNTAYRSSGYTTQINYPDIVAHAEGTGGRLHMVSSWSEATPNNYALFANLIIDSSGAISSTHGTYNGLTNWSSDINDPWYYGSTGTVNNHTYPSIAIDPLTQNIYATWSAGVTGASKGIRFRAASYSAGAWTWASEVDVDTTHYMQVSNFGSLKVLWDGTRAVVGGMVFDGSSYRVRVYDSTNLTSFTNRVTADIGTSMYATSMAVDKYTGDVYLFGNSHNGSNYTNVRYYKATRSGSTLTLGDPVVAETITGPASNPMFITTSSETGRISWIYTTGTGSPYSVKFNSFTITAASTTNDTTSKLVVNGNIEASSITINGVAIGSGGGSSVWLQNASDVYYTGGKVGIGTATPSAQLHVSGSTASTALLKVTDGTAAAVDVFTIADEGAAVFKNRTNSTAAFDVQNAAGSTVFNVDSTNQRVSIGVASGQKVNGSSAESIGAPTTIGTSTTGFATVEGAQRKLTKLSTGRTVAAFNIGGNYAAMYYSDNGTSWTNLVPGNGIDGWDNGSITSYLDAGGTERLVAVWKQSGTGGSRVDGRIYAMVGTFNAGRTAVTWGSAFSIHHSADANMGFYNYPDAVAYADGTGGQVAIVSSFNRSSPTVINLTNYVRLPIDASGAFGTPSTDGLALSTGSAYWGTLSNDYATNIATWPSVDYNPLTKDHYVAWSSGSNGAGRGLRFKRAAYSSGTWTWGSELEVDNTHYAVNDSTMLSVRYDASGPRVVIGAEGYDGSNGDVMLYDLSTTGTLTTTRELASNVVNSASRIAYGSMAVDPSTGNVYFAGSNNSSAPYNLNYRKWTRASGTSSIGVLDTIETAGGAGYASLMALNNSIGILYTKGPSSPLAVRFISISLPTNSYDTTSKLVVNGNIEASSITINGVSVLAAGSSPWLQNAGDIFFNTGKVSIGAGSVPTAQLHVKGSSAGVALLRVTDGTSVEQDVFTIADEGAATFRNRTNSTAAFDVQNAAGSTMLNVNTVSGQVSVGVASGQKSITIPTTEALNTPATITTLASSPDITTFSNQKKLSKLSTGRIVAVLNDAGGVEGEIWYSDDGNSWTSYASPIAGWANGSIYSYVDSGGTERLVAVWKQTGTGGGRTNNEMYINVGTFNSARTTLTWGTAGIVSGAAYWGGAQIDTNYLDVVVHPEGTGGIAHVVYSYDGSSYTQAYHARVAIDSSGVLSASWTNQVIFQTLVGGSNPSWPSIDIDLTTKRLFMAWSGSATGAGLGMQFRTAPYSSATWPWAAEVQLDTDSFVNNANYGLVVRWDGTRAIVGTRTAAGGVRQYESTNFTSFTQRSIVGNNNSMFAYGMGVNPATGDVYHFGTTDSSGTGLQYIKWNRSTLTADAPINIHNGTGTTYTWNGGGGYWPPTSAWLLNGRLGFVYTTGTSSPYNARYASITFGSGTAGLDTTSKLVVNGNIEASSITINGIALSTSSSSFWLQSNSNIYYSLGSVGVGHALPTARLHVSSGEPSVALLKITDSSGSGADVLTIADGGATTFKPQTNGTNTFDVQNAAGTSIINVDSTNQRVQIGVASGQKTITVFTGESLNSPVTIGTPAGGWTATATAYGNQKKLVTLSTGRMVEVQVNTTPSAQFYWSDDGATWTDFGSQILGWSNGSIVSYVDAGGVERLVAVWKQSGTGGGRTDKYIYAMTGAFNAGRTTLTWGTPVAIGANIYYDVPDVVAAADGSGGIAAGFMSYSNDDNGGSGTDRATYRSFMTINSSGVISAGADTNIGGFLSGQAGSTDSYPSADINPSTKDVYLVVSKNKTGSGNGIRFFKLTYGSGTWSVGTEREIANTHYINSDLTGNQWTMRAVYDGGSNVIIGGNFLSSGTTRTVWEYPISDPGTAPTQLLNTASSNYYSLSLGVNTYNRDVYLVGSFFSGTYQSVVYFKYNRATTTWSGPTTADTIGTSSTGISHSPNVMSGNNKLAWVYTTGTGAPFAVKYGSFSFTGQTTGLDTTSKLVVNGNIEASSITINGIAIGSTLGSQWIQGGNNSLSYNLGNIGVGTAAPTARLHVSSLEVGTALLKVTDGSGSGQDVLTIADGGAVTFKNQTNSTAAFDIQTAASATVFNVDTTNQRVSIGVASGQKAIYVARSATLNTAATVGTSSTTDASAYQNQKRAVTLSTGRMVAVYSDTGSNAKFKYSDSGTSWTDYASDIAGWHNGSISSYVDAGGTERLVAVWKQNGTGGGRTTNNIYVMVGTFNAGRTTLTWGTATQHANFADTNYNYPDLVAHAEGSGGMAHLVLGYTSAGNGVYYYPTTINASGVPTVAYNNQFGPQYANAMPSIDMNPTSKDIFVAYSAGTTGSGNGIRFRRGAYSAGTWTMGSDVEVDTTTYNAGSYLTLQARWNAYNNKVTVGGLWHTGSVVKYRVYESSTLTSFGTPIIDQQAEFGDNGTYMVDPTNGDIYIFGQNNSYSAFTYYKWDRGTQSLSSASTFDANNPGGARHTYAWYGGNAIRLLYNTSAANPYTVKYNSFTMSGGAGGGFDTTSKLVVNGNIEASSITINGVALSATGITSWLQSGSSIYTNSSSVGIGTSTPAEELHITATSTPMLQITDLTTGSTATDGLEVGVDSSQNSLVWNNENTAMIFGTNNLERLRITSAGNVGIGTSSPQAKLAISEAAATSYQLKLDNTGGYTTGNYSGIQFTQGGTTSTGYIKLLHLSNGGSELQFATRSDNVGAGNPVTDGLKIGNAGAIRFNTYGAGTLVTDSSGNVTASSDERLKDVQGNFNRGLSDLLNIDPILYKWNGLSGLETNGTYAGFSAQNIQVAIPEAVSTDSRGYLALQDRPILAASVNAIKEVHNATTGLDGRITALESLVGMNPDFMTLNVTGHSTLSSLTVTGNVTVQGKLTVANAEVTGSITIGGRILSNGNKPQITKGADLGLDNQVLAASVEIDGTDTAGTISFVAGITPSAGTLAKVTFTEAYEAAPRIVVTATNEDGLTLPVYVRKVNDGFEIVSNQAPVAGKTYQFDYVIIGAQASN